MARDKGIKLPHQEHKKLGDFYKNKHNVLCFANGNSRNQICRLCLILVVFFYLSIIDERVDQPVHDEARSFLGDNLK